MNGVVLEVSELVTVFSGSQGETPAVSGVSFALHRGETIGIVGESGSGKSVTSLTVMRLIPSPPGRVKSGSIVFHAGERHIDMVNAAESEIRQLRGSRIAMIFQEPMTSLNPVMRCGDQVMEAILEHRNLDKGGARARTLELFAEVMLPDPALIFGKYPHEISGGQKQRVMIAMALSCDPDVIIADEPTTALDVTVQKTILDLLKKLQARRGLGLIFITHDLGVIAEIADRVLVMYKGRVVEQATVLDLFEKPSHPYTRSLLACRPPLDSKPARLPVISDFMSVDAQGNFVERPYQATRQEAAMEARGSGEVILRVDNLHTWYPARRSFFGKVLQYHKAVNDVSFDVREGETLGLVGESGCGKSTLGRTIIRLTEARAGSVKYRGTELLGLSEKQFKPYRRKMQIIFQDPYSSLNPRVTVGEAIAEPLQVHRLCPEREIRNTVLDLLQKVGLEPGHYDRYPHEFSGGQRQRLCIARALALRPEFLICDESVSALDVSVQAQVLNLINDLKREFGFTCIFISHDLGVVKYMSDRLIVMQKGKIVEMGDAARIYASPEQDYTRRLISAIPLSTAEHAREVQRSRQRG